MRKINEIKLPSENTVHSMVVYQNFLCIDAGNGKIYTYELPKETLWEKILKFFAVKKYTYPVFEDPAFE